MAALSIIAPRVRAAPDGPIRPSERSSAEAGTGGLGVARLALVTAEDAWWAEDKALHLSVGGGLGAACYVGLWLTSDDPAWLRATLCAWATILPPLGKEIYDEGRPRNHFSGKDLLWSLVGAWIATAAAYGVELIVHSLAPAR